VCVSLPSLPSKSLAINTACRSAKPRRQKVRAVSDPRTSGQRPSDGRVLTAHTPRQGMRVPSQEPHALRPRSFLRRTGAVRGARCDLALICT